MIGSLRRNTELGLMVLGALVAGGAYTLGALGRTSTLPANIGPYLGVVLGLLLATHIVTRLVVPGADGVLLPIATLLNGLGYAFIARLNTHLAALQATWTLVGVLAFVVTLTVVRRPSDLQRYQWTLAFFGLGLLLLPLLPVIGYANNDARLWIHLGSINIQPGEIAKVVLALFFAGYLVERRELLAMATWRVGPLWLPEPRHLGPVVVAWATSVLIMVSQRDLGSSLLFFTLFVVMLWVATERVAYLAIAAVMFVAGAYGAWWSFSHVRTRVSIWLNPWNTPATTGYQIIQGTFAFAWGGLTGTGIGLGDPTRVPAVQTDFILAAIGEELGLLGSAAVLIAFLLMVGAGLRIALRAERAFDKLLATGLTAILGVQAFIIVGGITRVVPLTGVTLPFVSYGGSSLVANYVLLALLLRISHDSAVRLGEVAPRQRKQRRRRRRASAALEPEGVAAP